jgi:hypothetical protein
MCVEPACFRAAFLRQSLERAYRASVLVAESREKSTHGSPRLPAATAWMDHTIPLTNRAIFKTRRRKETPAVESRVENNKLEQDQILKVALKAIAILQPEDVLLMN